MRNKVLLVLSVATLVAEPVLADIHYVSTTGGNTSPYTNWTMAATTIQDAVTAAASGDTVLVSNGVYTTGSTSYGGANNRVVLNKTVTLRSVNGAHVTTIDGGNTVRCLGLGGSAVIDGFTLRNGNVTGFSPPNPGNPGQPGHDAEGGGVYFLGGGTVANCVISGNQAEGGDGADGIPGVGPGSDGGDAGDGGEARGGGVFFNSGGILRNCLVIGNEAEGGLGGNGGAGGFGGIAPGGNGGHGGDGGDGKGAGIYFNGGGTIQNSAISSNAAAFGFGGIRGDGGVGVPPGGPGLHGSNGQGHGGGTYDAGGGALWNSIIYYNTAPTSSDDTFGGTHSHCCSPGLGGSGNITGPPQFINAAAGNFRLTAGSPCIDAGTNETWMATAMDLDGYHARILGGIVDMGAYEDVPVDAGSSPIHYVSPAGAADWPFTNWADAATLIQDAIDAAASGDTVRVTNGIYTPIMEITVTNRITVESVGGRDVTTIDGQDARRCFNLGNVPCLISGFTITRGRAQGLQGGAIYCTGTQPKIAFCTISDSYSSTNGGGSHYGTFSNCLFTGNSAWNGGGCSYSWVYKSTLLGNTAEHRGGGSHYGYLTRCAIRGNWAGSYGGGSYQSFISHCLVTGNSASNGGGTAYGDVLYCTVTDNVASNFTGGCIDGDLFASIIYFNTAAVAENWYDLTPELDYCCTIPEPSIGTGNITNEPLFVDASSSNFYLAYGSPCIDRGPVSHPSVTNDFEGNPRPVDGNFDGTNRHDIGAYEYDPAWADTDGDTRADGVEHYGFGLDPVYDETDALVRGESVGESNVTSNPIAYNLYTSNTIMNLDMGYLMLACSNGTMHLSLQLQKSTNLHSGAWSNAGTAKAWTHPADTNIYFFRVLGGGD